MSKSSPVNELLKLLEKSLNKKRNEQVDRIKARIAKGDKLKTFNSLELWTKASEVITSEKLVKALENKSDKEKALELIRQAGYVEGFNDLWKLLGIEKEPDLFEIEELDHIKHGKPCDHSAAVFSLNDIDSTFEKKPFEVVIQHTDDIETQKESISKAIQLFLQTISDELHEMMVKRLNS